MNLGPFQPLLYDIFLNLLECVSQGSQHAISIEEGIGLQVATVKITLRPN